MNIQFGPQYETGIASVDAQHAQLFRIASDVETALALPPEPGRDAIGRAVRDLIDYTRIHFTHEEALMDAAGYPELAAHQKMHRDLLVQVQEMEMRIDIEDESTSLDLSRFLARWLSQHIQTADRQFADFAGRR